MAVMDTTVNLPDGAVRGLRGRGGRRGTIAWKGIPFAAAPVGARRWRAPEPVTPWPGVLDCDDYGNAPVQEKLFTARGGGRFQPRSEDCLTLNVFAPETVSATPRPVMVFVYGGAYILGSTSTPVYDGAYLARARDVIVVTVTYRVGALGFIDLSDYSTPDRRFDANVGFRDVIAGLEWVQRNIAEFGGDPDRVTVFGESAGGAAVVTLLSTPSAQGLFSRAIAQSPAPDLVVSKDNARVFADEFVRLLMDPERRCDTVERTEEPLDPELVARVVDGASGMELVAAGNRLQAFARAAQTSDPMPLAPTIDGELIPMTPLEAARTGATLPVPLLIGHNRDEGELFARFWNIMPDAAKMLTELEDPEVSTGLSAVYAGRRDDVGMSADWAFFAPVERFAAGQSATAPTYVYRYDYAPAPLKASGIGATHATELFAVFGIYRDPIGAPIAASGSWRSTAKITATVQSAWTWFARKGVPSPSWPQYSVDDRQVMVLDVPSRVEADPQRERRLAWERVDAVYVR